MQVLLFEMEPREGHEEQYFKHVDVLRPLLDEHEGLLFIDRFKSLSRPNIILSHSLWKDEASIAKWRTDSQHHQSQAAGRYKHFEDYRIRISHALEHYRQDEELNAWSTQGAYRQSDLDKGRFLVVSASVRAPFAGKGEVFKSVNFDDRFLTVEEAASSQMASMRAAVAREEENVTSVIISSVSRDYGMFERAEAPQYFKPVGSSMVS